MTQNKQHIIPAVIIAIIAVVVAWLSFTSEPKDAFLFPKVVSVVFVGLAIWNLIRATSGLSKTGEGLNKEQLKKITVGVVISAAYVLFLAKNLGFYVAATLTFFAISSLYDPEPWNEYKHWIKRIIITIIFIGVVYTLFAVTLKVQTPRGLWI